ncbi:MAG: GNAT family N-acetyltransferase [Candidatus Hermodarchaeota archaeon]
MSWIKKLFNRTFDELLERNPNYIQMRLPVRKITPEFEKMLRSKVEHNIFHAEVREANMNDIDCLIKLHDVAWHSTPMPYKPLNRESITKMLKDPNIIFLVAKVDGNDRGFALIYYTGEEKEIGVIAGMGIIPEYQRKGLGTILGLATWDYFKQKGVFELRCKVYKDNEISYNFIKGLGFEEHDDGFTQWKIF